MRITFRFSPKYIEFRALEMATPRTIGYYENLCAIAIVTANRWRQNSMYACVFSCRFTHDRQTHSVSLLFFFSTLFFQSVCFSSWRCKRGPTTVYLHAVRASVWVAILLRSIKSKQLAGKVFYRGMFQRLAFSHLYTSWVFLIVAQS